MARPPKYATEDEKPVSVTLRIPRDLYDEAQHYVTRRRTTLTELMVEGLRMRLETPTDPRDILVMHDDTVMQELRQMIADEVHAALAAQRAHPPESPTPTPPASNGHAEHYGNAVSTEAADHGHDVLTEAPAPARKAGRQRSPLGQQILALLAEHPEGLTAEQLRGHLQPAKPIGDILSGMKRLGTVQTRGQGRAVRYVLAHPAPASP
jgi:hypothetical protein